MASLLMVKTPIELHEIYKLSRKIRNNLVLTGNKRMDIESIHEARTCLEKLVAVLTSQIMEGDLIVKKRAGKLIYHYFKSDLGRMLRLLDESQEHLMDNRLMALVEFPQILAYTRMIGLYLDVLIIEPIMHASKLAPDDKDRFLYELLKTFAKNVSIFGAEARIDRSGKERALSITPLSQPQTYEAFNSEENQNLLEKEYDSVFKDVENLKRRVERKY